MSKLTLNFIFIFLILTFTSPTYSAVNNLYEEEISGYYEVSNEILRFDTKREFTISQYDTYNLELSGQNIPYVNISLIDDTTKGNLENIIHQISKLDTSEAFASIKLLLEETSSPISCSKVSSASM